VSADTTPTPDGWEWREPCFIRGHEGRLAVLERGAPEDSLWWVRIYLQGQSPINSGWMPLSDAVAWANDQLGVPKPVVVHEREFEDGWLLWCDQTGRSFRVSKNIQCRDYVDVATALDKGREYVRGVQ